ncbi:MAG: aminotransferase class V-fold PLP-dependent enzyme [Phormidesmis sp.]
MITELISRSNYLSLNNWIYLNQASLGLIGMPAVQAMHRFLDEVACHGNLNMTDDDEVEFFELLRQRGGRILNCDLERLAIVSSASELLGQLPFMLRPKSGSHILSISTDFPAVTRPWLRYAHENNCSLKFVDDLSQVNLTDALIEAIDEQTAVVAISYVQFSTGSKVDISRLSEAAKAFDAKLVVDVTQAAGTLKIDSQNWDVDAVVTSGYKWLGGHGGVAIAALSPTLIEQIPPLPGWMGTPHPFDFEATQLPLAIGGRRFTQSTMSYISIAGLTTALDQLIGLGETQLESHAFSLSQKLIENSRLHGWEPFRSHTDSSASPHIVALKHSTFDAPEAVEVLRQKRIVCGTRNGRIRISLAPYNNSHDISILIDTLASMRF